MNQTTSNNIFYHALPSPPLLAYRPCIFPQAKQTITNCHCSSCLVQQILGQLVSQEDYFRQSKCGAQNTKMYTQTQSTDISVLQLPERPVKEWARTMLQNGKALRLLQLIDLLPQISQLQTQGILSEFADIKEADVIQLAKGANKSSEKSLQERKDLWKALRDSEAQYIDEISSIMPSGKLELNLQIAVGYLSKCTQAYYGKFVTYLEKTKATQSQMASFENLRHVSHVAITHFSRYLNQVTEAICINRLSEIMKPRERVRSASQQKRSVKKKRQNQGQAHNPFEMPAESSSNKIHWRTISAQKRK